MKNLLTILFILLFSNYLISQNNNCSGCDNSSSAIISNADGSFSATNAQAYFWDICSGNGTFTGSNTVQGVSVTCTSDYTIKLTQFIDGNCIESCLSVACGSSCGVSIESIGDFNNLGSGNVAFVATTQLNSGWNITNSTFKVTYNDLSIVTYNGYLNTEGSPNILIPVNCNNSVIKVTVTVYASNSTGITCSATKTVKYFGVCGTSGYFKINSNPIKDILNIEIKEGSKEKSVKNEIVILNLEGNIVQKHKLNNEKTTSIDVSQLKSGLYIIKLISNNNVIESKKIIISD